MKNLKKKDSKRNSEFLKNKKEKGITLIALVITIIVLIILAGVTIATLTGDNGILTKASKAKEETEEAKEDELQHLDILENYINGDTSGANPPKLTEDMKKVYWDSDGNEIVEGSETFDQANWYNYSENRWANVKTSDGNYWVWIPRYEYKIIQSKDTIPSDSNCGKIEINFISESCTVANTGYNIHPAFINDSENDFSHGGWDKEISGFWVGKYETSRKNATDLMEGNSSEIKIVSGVQSYRNITIGDCYSTAFSYDRSKESHLIKNSEWGAVAYLSHSNYGRKGEEIPTSESNISYLTGYGGEITSSTGNMYGIYDLSGGAWEYVAAFNSIDSNSYEEANGISFSGVNKNSTKYATKYNSETNIPSSENCKIGDATYEVYINSNRAWFNDYSYCLNKDYPFFRRGGKYSSGSAAGVFYSNHASGRAFEDYSFRIVLTI